MAAENAAEKGEGETSGLLLHRHLRGTWICMIAQADFAAGTLPASRVTPCLSIFTIFVGAMREGSVVVGHRQNPFDSGGQKSLLGGRKL